MKTNQVKIKQNLPSYVLTAAEKLRDNGYEAYLVGGSVRDILLGKEPHDYDIATNAYPEEVQKIFEKSIPTGAKFGTIIVLIPDEDGENHDIEVTTYRSEADYYGGRWPTKVEFTKTIDKDLARRDFTINAMALRLDNDILEGEDIVDLFGGMEDLSKGQIRAVGDPIERFSEDGIRSLRACRLAANLGFEIEEKTLDAISKTLHITQKISMERVRDELTKMLMKSPKPSIGFELMDRTGLLELFIPELLKLKDLNQPEYHVDDAFVHTMKTVDAADDEVKLAALFHDIGKAVTRSEDVEGVHFYGHDIQGSRLTRKVMKRLKFSGDKINRTATLVRWHMFYYPTVDWRREEKEKKIEKHGKENMLTQLTLLRHGETELNSQERVAGQLDAPLSDKGIEQVNEVVKSFQDKDFDIIITSPLQRAFQTAEIISSNLNIELNIDARFQERNFGELQGLTWEEFKLQYPELASRKDNSPQKQEYLPTGESITEMSSRVKVGLYNLIKKFFGKNILLVTHAGVIRIIQRIIRPILTEKSQREIDDTDVNENEAIDLDNAGHISFEIDNTKIDPNFLSDSELEIVKQQQVDMREKTPGGWTDSAIRRFISRVGGEEIIEDLMKLRIADAIANPKSVFNPEELQLLSERIAKVRADDMALKVTDLNITGNDLIKELDLKPGPKIGRALNHLLEEVLEDPMLNKKETLLKLASDYIQNKI